MSNKSIDELEWLLGLNSPQKLNQSFKTILQKHDLDIFPPNQRFKATYNLINKLTGLSVLDKPLKQQYKRLALLKQELTLAVPSLFKGNWEPIAAGELMSWLTLALFNSEQWKLDEPFQLVFPKQEKGNSWVQFSLSIENQFLWTANPTIKD